MGLTLYLFRRHLTKHCPTRTPRPHKHVDTSEFRRRTGSSTETSPSGTSSLPRCESRSRTDERRRCERRDARVGAGAAAGSAIGSICVVVSAPAADRGQGRFGGPAVGGVRASHATVGRTT